MPSPVLQQPDAPLGSDPRRSHLPLVLWISAFAVWFVFLVWLAFTYPSRTP